MTDSIEVRVRVAYSGDASFSASADLLLNVPFPKFVTLPVLMRVSNIKIEGERGIYMLIGDLD